MTDSDDDYASDVEFGRWLKEQRSTAGLTLEQVAERTALSLQRLKSLELGFAARGVTKAEAEALAPIYRVDLAAFLARASGD